jgi:uncharacterized protein (TIGR02145 family)
MNNFTRAWLHLLVILGLFLTVVTCDKKYDGDDGQDPDPNTDPIDISFEIVNGTVTDIEGNIYETVKIAGHEWMAENLKTTKYRDGSEIEFPNEDNSLWIANNNGAYAWYKDDNINGSYYGAVYNWYAVVNSKQLCPEGWRVPNNTDWAHLIDYLQAEYSLSNDKDAVGGIGNRLKSCRQVRSPLGVGCATTQYPRWDEHEMHYGFNTFGFSALPIGSRNSDGGYIAKAGLFGHWWSISGNTADEAYAWYITFDNAALFNSSSKKVSGYAVRCIKN